MIFPELPRKHYQWTRSKTDIIELQADSIEEDTVTTKAPLRDSSSVDVDEWFRQNIQKFQPLKKVDPK